MITVSAVLLKIPVNTLRYIWNFTNNNFVKFIHFEIPLQQKIDQIIHLNSKKKSQYEIHIGFLSSLLILRLYASPRNDAEVYDVI